MSSNQQLLLGEGAGGGIPNYIEEVFSTYLYTGNSSTQTITNNIDLSTKGGLVWLKSRSGADPHELTNTVQGTSNSLRSNSTNGASSTDLTGFTSSGFTLGYVTGNTNASGATEVSWTFRKQKKFFDIVTYTGDGNTFQTVSHNLGSEPGCIIAKRTDTTGNWVVYHRSIATDTLRLNLTDAKTGLGGAMLPSSTSIDFYGSGGTDPLNASGGTYVAYLFAHNAGGFGLSGTDNVISCGSYAGSGAAQDINLGYEPQWVLVKNATTAGWDWYIIDNMRGFVVTPASPNFTKSLSPNTSGAESDQTAISPTATGFRLNSGAGAFNGSGDTYIYIAIRRGPMKVPTVGTSVYNAISRAGTGAVATVTGVGFTPDQTIVSGNLTSGGGYQTIWVDRLRGSSQYIRSALTAAEVTDAVVTSLDMDGVTLVGTGASLVNASASNYINWYLRRAPGFFDEVCYTGTGSNTTFTHNLGVVPEMMIVKCRSNAATNWPTWSSALSSAEYLILNLAAAKSSAGGAAVWNSTLPTSSVFSVGTDAGVNTNAATYVAYLFATCAGVSKVGSYTGNGSSQTIACGFTAGSRFVMIKRTDSTSDWYVWDSARGIVAGNDPHLSLNTTAAEVTTDDSVDTDNSGFIVNQDAATNVNVTSATYIFLAIA